MSSKKKLKKQLRQCEKVRDKWCKEYVKVRNKLKLKLETNDE